MPEDLVRLDDKDAFRNRGAEEAADHEPDGLANRANDAAVRFAPVRSHYPQVPAFSLPPPVELPEPLQLGPFFIM